jgi:hypothetical protein
VIAMLDQDTLREFVDELHRLNRNLEMSNQNSLRTSGELKTLNEQMRVLGVVAKRLGIFNQILLQCRKSAGQAGMLQMIMDGFVKMAREVR